MKVIGMVVAVLGLALAGPAAAADRRGTVIAVEPLGTMERPALQRIAAEFPGDIAVRQGARLFRLRYWTVLKGVPAQASGLVAIPLVTPAKGVVIYLHGTNATRALAPSQPDRVDGNEESAVFAGNGYIVALPDYLGLGASRIPHPYMILQPQVDASIDLLRAVRTAFPAPGSRNLFMMGFSQGGQVVSGLHRAIERQPLAGYHLKGTIGIAGPYDLRRASLPKAIENRCRQCVGYLAWAVYAYARYYRHPLRTALNTDYAAAVPRLFDGSKSAAEIGAALPEDPSAVFQPEFLAAMRGGGDNWFTRALARNESWAWVPRAPFRLYFGEDDRDVPPSASRALFDHARARGGNVSLHPLAGADHQDSASRSYAPALAWFDALGDAARRQ